MNVNYEPNQINNIDNKEVNYASYTISISCTKHKLILNVREIQSNFGFFITEYESTFSFEFLKNFPFFFSCKTMIEIANSLENYFSMNECLFKKDKGTLSLSFNINDSSDLSSVNITLRKKSMQDFSFIIKTIEKYNHCASKELSDLKRENNILKSQMINLLDNTNKEFKNLISQQNNHISSEINDIKRSLIKSNNETREEITRQYKGMEEGLKRQNEKNNEKYNKLLSNLLVDQYSQEELINHWICKGLNISSIRKNLIFKASEDGDKIEIFHQKCDNKGPTLILITTSKDLKIGGFTSVSWDSPEEAIFIEDKNAFIFSLDLKKVYFPEDYHHAIHISKEFGPDFGYDDLEIVDNFFKNKSVNKKRNYLISDGELLGYKQGEENEFLVKEMEIYQIIKDNI